MGCQNSGLFKRECEDFISRNADYDQARQCEFLLLYLSSSVVAATEIYMSLRRFIPRLLGPLCLGTVGSDWINHR
jgi:hypothetical protein